MIQRVFELTGSIIYICLYFFWAWFLRGTQRARIIVVVNGDVLLVKPWLGLGGWGFPGGGANKGEDLAKTACRELFEETKIQVDYDRAEFIQKDQVSHGLIRFTAHYYFVKIDAITPPIPHRPEIAQARWVSREGLDSLRVSKDVIALIDLCSQR